MLETWHGFLDDAIERATEQPDMGAWHDTHSLSSPRVEMKALYGDSSIQIRHTSKKELPSLQSILEDRTEGSFYQTCEELCKVAVVILCRSSDTEHPLNTNFELGFIGVTERDGSPYSRVTIGDYHSVGGAFEDATSPLWRRFRVSGQSGEFVCAIKKYAWREDPVEWYASKNNLIIKMYDVVGGSSKKILDDLQSSLPSMYFRRPRNCHVQIGQKAISFGLKYWGQQLISFTKFEIMVDPHTLWKDSSDWNNTKVTQEKLKFNVFCGFDSQRTKSDVNRLQVLFYVRGELVYKEVDARKTLGLSDKRNMYCQGLTVLLDDVNNNCSLNETEDDFYYRLADSNDKTLKSNIHAWLGGVVQKYWTYHRDLVGGVDQLEEQVAGFNLISNIDETPSEDYDYFEKLFFYKVNQKIRIRADDPRPKLHHCHGTLARLSPATGSGNASPGQGRTSRSATTASVRSPPTSTQDRELGDENTQLSDTNRESSSSTPASSGQKRSTGSGPPQVEEFDRGKMPQQKKAKHGHRVSSSSSSSSSEDDDEHEDECAALKDQLSKAQETAKILTKKNRDQASTIAALSSNLQTSQANNRSKDREIDRLREELNNLRADTTNTSSEEDKSGSAAADVNDQVKALKSQNQKLQSQLQAEQEENVDKDELLSLRDQEIQLLKKKVRRSSNAGGVG